MTGHKTVVILTRGTTRQDAGTLQTVLLLLPAWRGVGIAGVPLLLDVSFILSCTILFVGNFEIQTFFFFAFSPKLKVSKLSELKWNSFWILELKLTLSATLHIKSVICCTGFWLLFFRVAGLGLCFGFVMQTVLVAHRCFCWVVLAWC